MGKMNLLFRVALFLRDSVSQDYDLIPSDVSILMMLASHIGDREHWYIAREEISRECRLRPRQFSYRLKHLERLGLLITKRTGKANAYTLILPNIAGKSWSADVHSSADHKADDVHSTAYQENTDVHSSADQMCSTVQNRSAPECTHKEPVKKHKKPERHKKRASALPDDFEPDEQNTELAEKHGLANRRTLSKFINLAADRGWESFDWQARFNKFLRDEIAYLEKHPAKPVYGPDYGKPERRNGEVRSTVPFFFPEREAGHAEPKRAEPSRPEPEMPPIVRPTVNGLDQSVGSRHIKDILKHLGVRK
jgi:hypothetical protein